MWKNGMNLQEQQPGIQLNVRVYGTFVFLKPERGFDIWMFSKDCRHSTAGSKVIPGTHAIFGIVNAECMAQDVRTLKV